MPLLRTFLAKPSCSRQRVRGSLRSLPDLLMVHGVIIGVLLVAFVLFPKVQASVRAHQTAEGLNAMAHKLDTALSNQWDTDSAQKAGMFPTDWLPSGGGHPVDAWGEAVRLSSLPNHEGVQVTLPGVPSPDCLALMRHVPVTWPDVRIDNRAVGSENDRQSACQSPDGAVHSITFVHRPGQLEPLAVPAGATRTE